MRPNSLARLLASSALVGAVMGTALSMVPLRAAIQLAQLEGRRALAERRVQASHKPRMGVSPMTPVVPMARKPVLASCIKSEPVVLHRTWPERPTMLKRQVKRAQEKIESHPESLVNLATP